MLLGERLAISLDKHVGDKMTLFDNETYTVVGIFKSATVYENGSMVVLARGFAAVHGPQGPGERLRHRRRASRRPGGDRADSPATSRRLGKNIEATPTAEFVNSTPEIRFVHAMAWVTSAVGVGHRRRRHVEHHDHVGLRADQRDRHLAGDRLAAAGGWCG